MDVPCLTARSTAKINELKAANGGEPTGHRQRELSRLIADRWREEPEAVRTRFAQDAELRQLEYRAALNGTSRPSDLHR